MTKIAQSHLEVTKSRVSNSRVVAERTNNVSNKTNEVSEKVAGVLHMFDTAVNMYPVIALRVMQKVSPLCGAVVNACDT